MTEKDFQLFYKDIMDEAVLRLSNNPNIRQRLEFERKYWANIFEIEGLKPRIGAWLMNTLFWYGEGVLVQLAPDKYIVCSVVKGEWDITGEWNGGEVQLSPHMMRDFERNYKPFRVSKQKSAYFKWNDYCMSAIYVYRDFIHNAHQLENAFLLKAVMSAKIGQRVVKNDNSVVKGRENASWLNTTSPFVDTIATGGLLNQGKGLANEIKPLDSGGMDADITPLKEYISLYYQRFGRRVNANYKRERVITSETDNANALFPVLEREHAKNIEMGIEECNEKFGTNFVLYAYVPDSEDTNSDTETQSNQEEE